MLNTFRFLSTFILAAALSGGALAQSGGTPAPAACPPTLNHTFLRLQDEKPQSLCQYAGKVLLVVNTASYCAFTPQYEGLEALYDKYKGRGLVVLGFPSNDFFQEKSENKAIADFCENTYGVKFPMVARTVVRGSGANAFYQQLAKATGEAPTWNFHKYLIGRNGQVIAHYPSRVTPQELVRDIEKQLAAR